MLGLKLTRRLGRRADLGLLPLMTLVLVACGSANQPGANGSGAGAPVGRAAAGRAAAGRAAGTSAGVGGGA